MKKLALLIIICLCIQQYAKADLGSCLVYEAKFYLKDGTVFNGSIEISGDGDMTYLNEDGKNGYTSDEGMMRLINHLRSSNRTWSNEDGGIQNLDSFDKVLVYKAIEELEIIEMGQKYRTNYFPSIYGFVNENDVVYLDTSDIEKVMFWKAKYVKREWLTSKIVIAPKTMIQTISSQQYWNRLKMTGHQQSDSIIFIKDNYMGGFDLINYNSNNNDAEIARLAMEKLKIIWDGDQYNEFIVNKYKLEKSQHSYPLWYRILQEYRQRHFQELRRWFWKKGILILITWETC